MTDKELAMTRTWAEIDLSALEHNFRVLKGLLKGGARSLGVVKADGYGHGSVQVSKKLQECGADMLAVACVQEAIDLRHGGITMPILCLGQQAPELAPLMWENNVTQAVGDLENGRALSEAAVSAGKVIKIHLKLDTGMSRIGFYWPNGKDAQAKTADEMAALCRLPGLEVEGMFTHFANADGDKEYTHAQIRKFTEAKCALEERGVKLKICHCAASIGVLDYPEAHMNMGRFGLVLYGYASTETANEGSSLGLKPVMTVKSRISAVRALPAGTCVSYGCTATLKRDSILAVLPVGYADGYPRLLSNNAEVRIHGKICPVVGRVCMDMIMADVTDIPGVKAGDTATVLDEELITRGAKRAGTIIHEILTGVSPRVTRIYM